MSFVYWVIDFILHIDLNLTKLVDQYGLWIYGILFLIIFCETGLIITFFLPGDSLLFIVGALAHSPGNSLSVHFLFFLLTLAAVLGDMTNYFIGYKFGRKLLRCSNSWISIQSNVEKTYLFYEKYGDKVIILSRFIPIIRTFAPFIAGFVKMTYRSFALYNLSGALLWISFFIYGGYLTGDIPIVQRNLKFIMLGIIILSVLPTIVKLFISMKKKAKKMEY